VKVTADPGLLIYSTLTVYGGRRGGALPGSWFVAALAPLGHQPAAVRQALLRMTKAGELHAERVGRHKLYRLTPMAQAATAAGTEKLLADPPGAWDGRWTVCCYAFAGGERALRDRVRDVLDSEGFALLVRGVLVHVRDKTARISAALAATRPRPHVTVFRSAELSSEDPRALVLRLWHLRDLATRYRRFLTQYAPEPRTPSAADAFALRLRLALDFLAIAWDDPELPLDLLPADWPGYDARALARQRWRVLLSGTLQHGDAVLRAVDATTLLTTDRAS
jgi:phenylacetic acid degradation operon negative regulatory protein